jgi:hypothetical protein
MGEADGGRMALERLLERTERLLEKERQRADWMMSLLSQHGSALARIEQRCMAIEARLGSSPLQWLRHLTPAQWIKILTGLLLPLAVLVLTGNAELARKMMVP